MSETSAPEGMAVESTKISESDAFLTAPEVATRYRLHVTTVTKLCRTGQLGAIRTGNGRGHWRIPLSGINAYDKTRTPQVA